MIFTSLIIDKVYVKSILQYHGSIVFGKAVSKPSFIMIYPSSVPKFLCKNAFKELDAVFLFSSKSVLSLSPWRHNTKHISMLHGRSFALKK